MKQWTLAFLIVLLPALGVGLAQARSSEASAPPAVSAPPAASTAPPPAASAPAASERSDWEDRSDSATDEEDERDEARTDNGDEPPVTRRHHHHSSDNAVVNLGSDSTLRQGEHADSVVAIFGSSNVEGETSDAVAVLGNTRVTGSVHDTAVAVMGNVHVDGAVDGDVVAVMGNVELGPNAVVGHDAVAVGGVVHRDPTAIVRGNVQSVGGPIGGFDRVHPWIRYCLLYGRPLAFVDGIGWAWGCALVFLGLYMGLALLFRGAVTRCVETFETRPGMSIVAALLTPLLIPVLIVLLFITVIGIAAIPFVAFGLFCLGLFGKTVILAWIGGRCLKGSSPALNHPVVAVLIGGLIVLALYVVPVLGFLVYNVLGLLGLGVVVYTLVGNTRAWRDARNAGGPPNGRAPGPAYSGSAYYGPAAPGAAAAAVGAQTAPASGAPPAGASAAPAAASAAASTVPDITAALPRAGFWIRMVALLLDALLVGFLMHLLHHMFNLELVTLAIYGAIMWKLRGSTIGGIVFDLHVVRLDGRPIDWQTAIVRALGCFLSLAVAGLGFFWIAFDRGRQGWHDKIAGTAVVRVAKGLPLV